MLNWKSITALCLLLAVALQSFNRAVIVGGYYAAAYAKACENKARPEMKCGGRCQMMKKLEAEEKKDKQAPTENRLDLVLSSKSFFTSFNPLTFFHKKLFPLFIPAALQDQPRSLFHPPGKVQS